MTSTREAANSASIPAWRSAGLRFFTYRWHLEKRFGRPVRRVSVDAGCDCPNRDGTVATGGCVFCDPASFSPSRRSQTQDITLQIQEGVQRGAARFGCDSFLAYFQPSTNTYAPIDRLKTVYEQALSHPQVVGLVVGTRPDCVPDEVLDLLKLFADRGYVSVEYGMQSMHDRSLDWLNRGHHHHAMVDAVARSRQRDLRTCAHVILGLPGESRQDMLATARELARLRIDAVKIHNLCAIRGTSLGEQVRRGQVQLLDRESYLETLTEFIEELPPSMVVERISGDAPRDYLLEPLWCLDKQSLRRDLEKKLQRRDSWQGKRARNV